MKVCQIMAGDEEGGLENHFVELSNGLLDSVDELTVIAHEKYRQRFLPGIRFIPLDLSRGRRNPLVLLRLIRILRREAPDIIHAQANKAVDMLGRVRRFVPGYRIGTLHGRKKNLSRYAQMDTVIGVSKGVVTGLKHPDVRVVYNGILPYQGQCYDKTQLAALFSLDSAQPISLAAGRLVPTKAFDNLIEAWSTEFGQLLIVGDGPEQQRLSQLIYQHGLEDKIKLTGFRADVRGLMHGADLLLVSSHREGFNYTVAEALMCGLPVLSTQVPVASEILPASYLVEVDNVPELSSALERVVLDLPKARQEQQALFDWAAQALTIEHMVSATASIYRDVLFPGSS